MRLLEFLHRIDEEALLEAAKDRYMQMFQNIPTEIYTAAKVDDSKVGDIIANTMRTMKRADRITWALRLTRYYILELAKLHTTEMMKKNINKSDTEKVETAARVIAYVEKEQRRMSVKSNLNEKELENAGRIVAVSTFMNSMEHFLSLPIQGIQNYQFAWQIPDDVLNDFEELERVWQESRRQALSHSEDYDEEEINKIISFKDGSAWFDLQRSSCPTEGDAMGHCGNTADTLDDHTVLSYRTPVTGEKNRWKPHMTFILNKSNGTLGEMKGRANEKPTEKYHPYIVELLKQPYIKGFGPGGYQPENNFNINDLPEEQAEALKELKPGFMTPVEQYKKHGMSKDLADRSAQMLETLSGEPTTWHEEDKEFTIDSYKNLTQAVEFVGGDTAKWVNGVMDGTEDDYQDHYSHVTDDQIEDLLDDLDPEVFQKIGAYAEAKYGEEYDEDEIDYTDSGDLVRVYEDWEESLIETAKHAISRGYETGAQDEMYEAFTKWLKDVSKEYSMRIKHEWDEGAELRVTEEGLMEIISNDEVMYDIENEGFIKSLEMQDLDQPYNGWSGYSEEAAKESFMEELDKEIENYEAAPEEVEA